MLYAGTFSKSLFPGLRLAYLVVPPTQLARFAQAAQSLQGCASQPLQMAVGDFMEQGHFARHLRRMRTLYAQRRVWLVEALENTFGTRLHIQPQAGGIHVVVDQVLRNGSAVSVRGAREIAFMPPLSGG